MAIDAGDAANYVACFEADGSLTPLPDLQLPPEPEVHMGGHGLYGSIGEYMKFIRMWLNDGAGPRWER